MKTGKFKDGTLFIANGKWFFKLESVERYAQENNWRISNIEKRKSRRKPYPNQAIVTLEGI